MSHLSDGVLRRLRDEPLALTAAARQHLGDCLRCQGRLEAVSATAGAIAAILAIDDPALLATDEPAVLAIDGPTGRGADPTLDVDRALARLSRSAAGISPARPAWYRRLAAAVEVRPSRLTRPALAGALAVGLSGTLVLTGAAQNVLNLFEPKQVQSVTVSLDALGGLPDLASFGTVKSQGHPTLSLAASRGAAATASGLSLLEPGSLPAKVPATPTWRVMNPFRASFTFDLARAEAASSAAGKPLPPPPAGLDGSTLTLSAGPAVVETFGERAAVGGAPPAGADGAGGSGISGLPVLAVVQMRTPRVTSTNVTVTELENYIAAMPGVSPALAAAIRSIGDPANTLPIPVPIDRANSRTVQVQGVNGVLVGDNSGVGSALVWVKGGEVYAVLGSLTESDVQAVANSLK